MKKNCTTYQDHYDNMVSAINYLGKGYGQLMECYLDDEYKDIQEILTDILLLTRTLDDLIDDLGKEMDKT